MLCSLVLSNSELSLDLLLHAPLLLTPILDLHASIMSQTLFSLQSVTLGSFTSQRPQCLLGSHPDRTVVHVEKFCMCHKCDVPILLARITRGRSLLKDKESMCSWGSLLGWPTVKRDTDKWENVLKRAMGLVRDLKTTCENRWKG